MEYTSAIAFLDRFAAGEYTAPEHRDFIAWLNTAEASELHSVLEIAMARDLALPAEKEGDTDLIRRIENALDEFDQEQRQHEVRVPLLRRITRITAAAAVLLLLAVAAWWFGVKHKQQPGTAPAALVRDMSPGRNAAVLTLSGGRQLILDSTAQDTVLIEGDAIIANAGGHLAYNPGSGRPEEILYNTLTTQRGNQYQLVLPDGTRVWLNASSSIRYPTAFTGADRTVEITGEAYLEVAHKERQPFRVKAGDALIEDLGTHFNINAYPDEPALVTTLVEGSVKVGRGAAGVVIRPGQEASLTSGASAPKVSTANVQAAIAWKNGVFELSNTGIASILRQVARWYDVDIKYNNGVPKGTISGEVPRNLNLSEVLKVMALSGVHCELSGRTLTVSD